jgi:hypothetical protein
LHFTAQQRLQFERLLQRWVAMTDQRPLPEPPALRTAREALRWLLEKIEQNPFELGRTGQAGRRES